MAIERLWNREPGWYFSQSVERKAMLLADLRLSLETPDQAKKANRRAKRRRLDVRQDDYLKKHGH